QIEKLRTRENIPRTRDACMRLLQRFAIYFHPERPDLLGQLQHIAADLGGGIDEPSLGLKYRWLQKTLGWTIAKKAQRGLPALRSLLDRHWEALLCRRQLRQGVAPKH